MRLVSVFFLSLISVSVCFADTPSDWAKAHLDEMISQYRAFHEHPELSFQEASTSEAVAKAWREAGFTVTTGIGGHGVVGILKNGSGPTVMLRTDMDALPVVEKTGLEYAAKGDVMHACGHDIHMTNLTGVARYLAGHRNLWSGTVMLVGQPAEERGRGASAMIKDGLFRKFPKPDYALALHVDSTLEAGKVSYHAGYTMASADSVDITLHGKGGHGAAPQTTIDPIVMGAQLVIDLQTLASRETNPLDPVVVTVGSFHGGTKHNLIPDSAHLQLTVRTCSQASRDKILEGIRRKASAVAQGAKAPEPEVKISDEATPALYNDPKLVDRVVPALKAALGPENVVPSEPVMASEDFSRYAEAGVPVFMFRLGSISPERMKKYRKNGGEPPSLHSPLYYPDPAPTLTTGVVSMTAATLALMKSPMP